MLEGLATWFLNNYLGNYLQNLNTDQLSIGLLQGEVELENVPLRRDALRFLEPALEVRSGFVGHIKLSIPVSRLRSEPWTLLLEKVYIVVGPQTFKDYDEEADDQVRVETKLAALDGIEGEWRAVHDTEEGSYYPTYSSWLSYGTSFIGTIVENLQLKIKDVHVRYEDDVTIPGAPFAAGFTLESLAAETCDETWSPKFVHRDVAGGELTAYKIVELTNMAAYLDPCATMLGAASVETLSSAMSVSSHSTRHHILNPVTATATLKRHCCQRPLNSRKIARNVAHVQVRELSLDLTDTQYQLAISAARTVHTVRTSRQWWRYRPPETVKGNARLWWKFAIKCTLHKVQERRESATWENVIRAAKDNVVYVEAFIAQLENPASVPDRLQVIKEEQDNTRSYEELKSVREIAVYRLKKQKGEIRRKGSETMAMDVDEEIGDKMADVSASGDSPDAPDQGGQSRLKSWFPLWGGWYSQAPAEAVTDEETRESSPPVEDSLLDALADDADQVVVAYKDVIFSHVSILLKHAALRLTSNNPNISTVPEGKLLFEVEFTNLKVEHESRPRMGSMMFGLHVGAVYLRDKITTNSLFPVLISPQNSEAAPLHSKAPQTRFGGLAKSFQSFLPSALGPSKEVEESLLDLLYEQKPFSSKSDYRLHIKSQPLDIVYNPIVIKCLSEFFKIPEDINRMSHLSEKIRSAALTRLEQAKQRTKEEFTRNINEILEGHAFDRKVWDVMLDLSAPQLLIPEHFEDKQAHLIVIDFGKMRVTNQNTTIPKLQREAFPIGPKSTTNLDDEDEDDVFVTPSSTPGTATPPLSPGSKSPVKCENPPKIELEQAEPLELGEAFLHNKMYDKYAIDFNNMQIIVGQVKDNWKGAHMKGNSSLHVVDRFSISMQASRRTVETNDPAWPSVLVSAMLPKLMFHVNEEKLVTVQRMLSQLAGPGTGTRTDGTSQTESRDLDGSEDEETLALFSGWQPKNQVDVTSKLLFAHFCVSDLSVELQSQGKSVAELQVTNMKAGVTRRPYDTNLAMSVHSLLLVDAMQTFGPDYELLIASHRHVTVDSVSGSLRGSDPQSPMSPGSPEPSMTTPVSAHDINQALLSSFSGTESPILRQQSSNSGYLSPESNVPPCRSPNPMASRTSLPNSSLPMDILDPNALISVDIMLVSPSCPTLEDNDKLQIINIQFNSLDVIANQETIIELLGFTRRVFPKSGVYAPQYSSTSLVTKEMGCQTDATEESISQRKPSITNSTASRSIRTTTRTELTAEFQRLNVLLLRAVTGKRTGTALLTNATIHATMDHALSASGSLGGLQVMNLLSSSPVHQRIISVGREPLVEEHLKDQATTLHSQMYPQCCPTEESKHAFTFSICQQMSVVTQSASMMDGFNSCHETNYNSCTASGFNSLVGTPKLNFDPFLTSWDPDSSADNSNTVKVSLHLSSVVYTHSSVFVEEMNSCATEFKRYMSTLAQSITNAATEMALGIVHRRTEAIITAPSFTVGREMTPPHRPRSDTASSLHRPRSDTASSLQRPRRDTEASLNSGYKQWDFVRPPAPTPRTIAQTRKVDVNLELDMVLETPVVVFPRIESGFEVLVAHLGQITVKNHVLGRNDIDGDIGLPVGTTRVDRYVINIHDMNLNSLNLQTKFKKSNLDSIVTQIKCMTAQDLYSSLKHGVPILHDTKIEVCVDEIKKCNMMRESQSMNSFMFMEDLSDLSFVDDDGQSTSFQIQGKVVNQLKVSLSRSQYQQVLDTMKSPAAEPDSDIKVEDLKPPEVSDDSPSTSSKRASNIEHKRPTPIEGSFELPLFSLELRGDMINNSLLETGLVSLACTDFAITYEKSDSDTTNLQMALKGLIMEDLLQDENSPHRTLMISSACPPNLVRPRKRTDVMSTSCPDASSRSLFCPDNLSTSLPDRLDTKIVFGGDYIAADIRKPSGGKMERNEGTKTPPASPCDSPIFGETLKRDLKSEENLVHLNVTLINANSPDFSTKYKNTNKFVDVDFNSVDINFNLQTWVVILDFFGIGSAPGPEPVTIKTAVAPKAKQDHENTELDIRVKCLSIVFNKNADDLFKATVLNYVSQISLRDGNCTIEGRLGNFCIKDLTSHGLLYRDRFLCRGEQILNFKIFKYGQPDEALQRGFDISVKLRMSAITYVHTQRFFTVLTGFFQQFQQLQAFMNNFREESIPRSSGVGFKNADKIAGRGSRILLDVEAGAPLLILPMSSYSSNVLMVDLGFLEINNKFMFAGDEGTISAIKLGSIKSCELGARRSRANFGSGSSARSRSTARSASRRSRTSDHERGMSSDATGDEGEVPLVSRHKCLLDVMFIHLRSMDLNTAQRLSAFISDDDKKDGDVNIGSCLIRKQNKPLLKANCELKLQIERNLDKAFCHYVPDLSIRGLLSKVHAAVDVDQYKIIRGFLAFNLGEQIDQQDDGLDEVAQVAQNNFDDLWTTTFMDIELQNVTVDLIQVHEVLPHVPESGLARINFIKSRLVYESFSDFSKDVDLVSQEILLIDTRFTDFPMNKRSNVFTCILQPMASVERTSLLQAEVHFRSTNDVNRFTILLNNMRLMGVFDWWLSVFAFISQDSENPQTLKEDFEREKNMETKMINLTDEPLYPSSGVVSRRHPVIQTSGPVFELKLNVTDSELVVLADTSQWESSAVILRSTTVLAFRPALTERPLSCNLNNAEVFSCILGKEEDTALSIIDPVTINLEVWCRTDAPSVSKGLLDMAEEEVERVAEIQLQQLNIRLSYHDWIMFRHILNSLPQQLQDAIAGSEEKPPDLEAEEEPANMRLQIGQLSALGFARSDCLEALQVSAGQLDEAALWLTQNANPSKTPQSSVIEMSDSGQFLDKSPVSFSAFYFKTSQINLVIIDDCKDADCPLFEISISSLNLRQKYNGSGFLSSSMSASYYNRALSAWEPCMEPWHCGVDWNSNKIPSGIKNEVRIKATDTINLNITSTLVELFDMVRRNWGEDYYNISRGDQYDVVQTPPAFRIRTPFVPYSIHNNTGGSLWFSTHVINADSRPMRHASGQHHELEDKPKWREVCNGETVAFEFESRTKQRHQKSRQHQIHQVVVRVDGWQEVKPVSVDRVGTFFRGAVASRGSIPADTPPVRLVFQVTLEGSARKLVTVRSALQVENLLPVPIQIKLNNRALKMAEEVVINLAPKEKVPVPLLYCWADMVARPVMASICQWKYSDKAIHWCHIINSSGNTLELYSSEHAWNAKNEPYRFCVAVRRLGYPQESLAIGPSGPLASSSAWVQPAHVVTFLPPVTLINLLPAHLQYSIQGVPGCGTVKPGKESCLLLDTSYMFILDFSLENFPNVGSLIMHPGSGEFEARIKLSDTLARPLYLSVKVSIRYNGAINIKVFAPYWIVNKTGLPLLFRQDNEKAEAAGQFEEHELARMVAPLLFSFAERDSNLSLLARVGVGLHEGGRPSWCKNFYVQTGSKVRRLRVAPPAHNNRPEWVYIIGIDVRAGKGRYQLTTIITLSPRFQLYNHSPHRIQFSQQCFASSFHDPGAEKTYLTAHPQSSLAFHWPRLDMDQLLAMRLLDVAGSQWSGGFLIENADSFQLTLRDRHGRSRFLRVEISLQSSTFCVVISNADNFPPPFRIDNFSEVGITFYQTGISDQVLRTMVKPHQSVPYAWDAPVLPPHLTVSAPGGNAATYNMNVIGAGSQLTYENFIYIAVSGTFEGVSGDSFDVTGLQLVLDVSEGSKVTLSRKSGAKRSQLWRMTSTGMLHHEGSSPPSDPRYGPDQSRILVLDIAGPAVQPGEYVPLMLRKPDQRRTLTQRWRFTEDGRLQCQHNGLFVQVKDGFANLGTSGHWMPWQEVVLGPPSSVCLQRTSTGVPIEQALCRQRLRPGSGFLGVTVSTDGPTRVLQITDLKQAREKSFARVDDPEWVDMRRPRLVMADSSARRDDKVGTGVDQLQVVLMLKGGLGISLVSRDPSEELVYALLTNIVMDYQSLPTAQLLDGSVQNIQVDSQLVDCPVPVLLYLSPSSKTDDGRHLPAIHFAMHRNRSPNNSTPNAEIFKHFILTIKNMTINIEEELLCKICKFAHLALFDGEQEGVGDDISWDQELSKIASATQLTRYYFGAFKLTLNQIKLSVLKSNKLSSELREIKRKLGLSLISFEDATIELEQFSRTHPFETLPFLKNSIVKHYHDELLSQAVLILGSTDFLGNPIGFLNDVSEGVSGLVSDGDLGGLVKNVAHGGANSISKLLGSASSGIGRATLDEKYDEKRLMIRKKHSENSQQHLVAGLKGFGFGVLGGLTSWATEPIEGAAQDGLSGFVSGLGRGVVSTISKPTIGVLDLFTGAASAVRESSRASKRSIPQKLRPVRVVAGPGGALPPYSEKAAQGQECLYRINGKNYGEMFVGYEVLRKGTEDLQVVVSSERVVVFSQQEDGRDKAVLTVGYCDLQEGTTRVVTAKEGGKDKFYIEFGIRAGQGSRGSGTPPRTNRPQVRCDSEQVAQVICTQINYARTQWEEMRQALPKQEDEDWEIM